MKAFLISLVVLVPLVNVVSSQSSIRRRQLSNDKGLTTTPSTLLRGEIDTVENLTEDSGNDEIFFLRRLDKDDKKKKKKNQKNKKNDDEDDEDDDDDDDNDKKKNRKNNNRKFGGRTGSSSRVPSETIAAGTGEAPECSTACDDSPDREECRDDCQKAKEKLREGTRMRENFDTFLIRCVEEFEVDCASSAPPKKCSEVSGPWCTRKWRKNFDD